MLIPDTDSVPVPALTAVGDVDGTLPAGVSGADVLASAPAKLNLFLHITGRRPNGYHELQTVFRFIDLQDRLTFRVTTHGDVTLTSVFDAVLPEDNLIVKAARALQAMTGCRKGCHITLEKVIPVGAGLGGGSSDAATTLVVLNHLWKTRLTLAQLLSMGRELGADVPVFVAGHACWAEGTGDELQLLDLEPCHYVVVHPGVHVDTASMFAAPQLTRNCSTITIRDFRNGAVQNVFEPAVFERYPRVAAAAAAINASIEQLQMSSPGEQRPGGFSRVSMTGSGSSLFVGNSNQAEAHSLHDRLNNELSGDALGGDSSQPITVIQAAGLDRSPLYRTTGPKGVHVRV